MLDVKDQTETMGALARAIDAGDPVALKVLAETARYLGAALAGPLLASG